MKNNKMLILTAFLLTTAFGLQAKDTLQRIHFKNSYRDKGKLQDVYLDLTWRQRLAPHTKNTTHVTIPAGHTDTQKAPLLGYYLQDLKATPSGAMVIGAGFTGIAHAGNNSYFEITSGKTPTGALNNKAEITAYKDEDAYNLTHGIVAPVKTVIVENNAPIVQRAVVRPNTVVVENNAPIVERAVVRPNTVVVEDNAPIARRAVVRPNTVVVEDNAPIARRAVVRPNTVVVDNQAPNVVVVDNNTAAGDRKARRRLNNDYSVAYNN